MKTLYERFINYVKNNNSYCNTFKCNNGYSLLVVKYSHLKVFDITVLDKNKNHIIETYNDLYPYDAANMIEELMINYC
jgi:hypothetical protein